MKLVRIILLASMVSIMVAVMLPNTEIAAIRRDFKWLSEFINVSESRWPNLDVLHLLMFGGLGLLAGIALVDQSKLRVALGLVIFAGLTELMQFASVGRNARWSDFAQDVVGALAGLTVAWAILWGLQRLLQRLGRL